MEIGERKEGNGRMESYEEIKKPCGVSPPLEFEITKFQCPRCRVEISIPHLGELPPNLELTCPKCGVKILDFRAHVETDREVFNPSKR